MKEEERLKELKVEIREIEEKELPDAMASCNNMTRFDLADGSQILVKDDLSQKLNVQLGEFEEIISKRIPAFNKEFKSLELEYLVD